MLSPPKWPHLVIKLSGAVSSKMTTPCSNTVRCYLLQNDHTVTLSDAVSSKWPHFVVLLPHVWLQSSHDGKFFTYVARVCPNSFCCRVLCSRMFKSPKQITENVMWMCNPDQSKINRLWTWTPTWQFSRLKNRPTHLEPVSYTHLTLPTKVNV